METDGKVESLWARNLSTEFHLGHAPHDNARAIDEHVNDLYQSVSVDWDPGEYWEVRPLGRLTELSDRNTRASADIEVSRSFDNPLAPRLVYLLTWDNMHFVSPNYYSPQSLVQQQLGALWSFRYKDQLELEAGYLPGFGRENHSREVLVHAASIKLAYWITPRLSLQTGFNWNKRPSYGSSTAMIGLNYYISDLH